MGCRPSPRERGQAQPEGNSWLGLGERLPTFQEGVLSCCRGLCGQPLGGPALLLCGAGGGQPPGLAQNGLGVKRPCPGET